MNQDDVSRPSSNAETMRKTRPKRDPSAHEIETAFRRQRALELRLAGYSLSDIQAILGFATELSVRTLIADAVKSLGTPEAEELRALEVERLDTLIKELMPLVKQTPTNLGAVDRVVKIMERRAALMGLDKPKQIEVKTNVDYYAEELAASLGLSHADIKEEARRLMESSPALDIEK